MHTVVYISIYTYTSLQSSYPLSAFTDWNIELIEQYNETQRNVLKWNIWRQSHKQLLNKKNKIKSENTKDEEDEEDEEAAEAEAARNETFNSFI